MSTRVITPPSMDLNRDMTQACPDGGAPQVVAIPESGEGLPEGASESAGMPLGCPSPASSPNSSSNRPIFPGAMSATTELILSTKIKSVPRCLFGPPDPRTAEFAREKVREMCQQDKAKYNFDFDAEKPLEGPFKWEPVPVAPPNTTSGNYAPKAYALSRFPFLSGSIDRGMVSPPPRTTINNNQLPPTRELYFQPDREPLFVVRSRDEDQVRSSSAAVTSTVTRSSSSPVKSHSSDRSRITRSEATTVISLSPVTAIVAHHHHHHHQSSSARVLDPAVMLIPSPEASSCSSEDSANVEMELEEDVVHSVDSSSTEDELKISVPNAVISAVSSNTLPCSSSSGLSSRLCSSASSNSSRRTKSVSSSSSSPSASPSSPTSSQPKITSYIPTMRNKRPASTSTTKAASESAPNSSAATEKRAAL